MSFLEPLFLAGALAVAGPVLFHLIRKSPRGRIRFSSLLFLRPSPPRITRRSRLDDLLLLALRAAALCLLALAFSRPFLRQEETAAAAAAGARRVLLLDTSASMRRADLWTRALARAEEALAASSPGDDLALLAFDDRVRELVPWSSGPPAGRRDLIRAELARLEPSWRGTDLGGALVAAADALDASRRAAGGEAGRPAQALEIVLISDLQEGSRLEALAATDWPEGVRLRLERIDAAPAAGAGIALLDSGAAPGGETRVRVRVTNDSGAATGGLALAWRAGSAAAGDAVPVQVPPGESRVVALERPGTASGSGADRIVLVGGAGDFDDTVHVAPPRGGEMAAVWIGDDAAGDPQGLWYYLERALASGGASPAITRLAAGEPLAIDPARPPALVVVARAIDDALAAALLAHAAGGGTVLCIATDAGVAHSFATLLECPALAVEEAAATDYAILAELDFTHPLLAPFAGRAFGDFSQVRFWRHRRILLDPPGACGLRVIARFDDGAPAWIVKEPGRGRIVLLSSGWQPRDSQLALSTRFVPLIAGLAGGRTGGGEPWSFTVGEPIPLPSAGGGDRSVLRPDGLEVAVPATASAYEGADVPGLYTVKSGREARAVAVNLAPAETRTAPLEIDELARRGVTLGATATVAERGRQVRDVELERSQGLWKWLVTAALAVLILETWLAGRGARRAAVATEGS